MGDSAWFCFVAPCDPCIRTKESFSFVRKQKTTRKPILREKLEPRALIDSLLESRSQKPPERAPIITRTTAPEAKIVYLCISQMNNVQIQKFPLRTSALRVVYLRLKLILHEFELQILWEYSVRRLEGIYRAMPA